MAFHCDCSSLTQTSWAVAGVHLPRTAAEQWKTVPPVPGVTAANLRQVAQPGDLIFSYPGEDGVPGSPGHVALVIGDGKLIEAPQPGQVVHIVPIYTTQFLSLGRPA